MLAGRKVRLVAVGMITAVGLMPEVKLVEVEGSTRSKSDVGEAWS
jgi:hypothetical protein